MSGTVKLQEECLCGEALAAREENGRQAINCRKVSTLVNENHLRFQAKRLYPAFLVGKEPSITLQGILRLRNGLHLSSKGLPNVLTWSEIQIPLSEVGDTIGSDSLSTSNRLLQEHSRNIGVPLIDFHLHWLHCFASAYVSGYCFSSLKQNRCK